MSIAETLNGATRVIAIIGDPITQVKSPSDMTQALLDAGVSQLAIHDADSTRRDGLVARLTQRHSDKPRAGSADPSGYAVVVNATPMGMLAGDPLPLDASRLSPAAFVGDVITMSEVTPLIAAARALGCGTQVGTGMFAAVRGHMLEFLLDDGASSIGRSGSSHDMKENIGRTQ